VAVVEAAVRKHFVEIGFAAIACVAFLHHDLKKLTIFRYMNASQLADFNACC
jgi:hypothetical protein